MPGGAGGPGNRHGGGADEEEYEGRCERESKPVELRWLPGTLAWIIAPICPDSADGSQTPLGEDSRYDLAGDVGQAERAPLESIREPLVVEPEQMQDGRLQVVYVHWVFDDPVA